MKSLNKQFIFAMLSILLISFIIAFFIANFYYLNVTKKQTDSYTANYAKELTYHLNSMETQVQMDQFFQMVSNLGFQIAVLDDQFKLNYFGNPFEDETLPYSAKKIITEKREFHGINDNKDNLFFIAHFSNELKNTVGVPFTFNGKDYGLFIRQDSTITSNGIHTVLIGFIFTIAIVSTFGMILLARRLTKPISHLTEATKQMAQENFHYELRIDSKDELGQLAESFNTMREQLLHNDLARKSFINNVSHDFQSPLMNVQGYAELLKNKNIDTDTRIKYASIIDSEAKRLSILTKQLLLLTSLDQSPYPMNLETYSLDTQLKEVIRKYYWWLEETNIDISYKMEPTLILANKELLLNVWENLISNAIKYNKENGSIEIQLFSTSDTITILIKDTGIGIKEEELPHIFERFYRVDTARKTSGTGLGLAIVEDIVKLHHGQLFVSSELGKGTIFTIKFKNKRI